MKKGFDFLRTKDLNLDLDINKKEKEFGINLPPFYRKFIDLFELGEDKFNLDHYLDEDEDLAQLGSICFYLNDEKIYLNDFLDVDQLFTQWKNSKEDIEWKDNKLLRIAYLGQAGFGGLYVGCNENLNWDQIWVYNADNEVKFIKITDDIFSFISRLHFTKDFSDLDEEAYSNLYKEWEEDFWRLRNDAE